MIGPMTSDITKVKLFEGITFSSRDTGSWQFANSGDCRNDGKRIFLIPLH
jgi:hypothetical protein